MVGNRAVSYSPLPHTQFNLTMWGSALDEVDLRPPAIVGEKTAQKTL